MQKLVVAMYDEEGYTVRLADYFMEHQSHLLDIRLFTSEESFRQYVSKYRVDLILLGEKMQGCLLPKEVKTGKKIYLSDGERVCESTEDSMIFKYQSAEMILQEILSVIAEDDTLYVPALKKQESSTCFAGFFAPYGGAGVSTMALQWAEKYGKQGKCLYINLELFDGMGHESNKKAVDLWRCKYLQGMSELLFYLRQNKGKLGLKMESLLCHGDVFDTIAGVEDYRDLFQMTTKDLYRLLHVLAEEMVYEYIVFDVGFFGEVTIALLKCMDKIYMPAPLTARQKNKQMSFENLLRREGLQEMITQIQYVDPKRCTDKFYESI